MEALAIPLLLFVGSLLAVQAAANVQLAAATASPFGASALQLGVGAAVLLLAGAVAGSLGALEALPEVDAWQLAGGLGSALYITSGIVLFPRLGAVVTVGLWISGQMLASAAIDAAGLFGSGADGLGAAQLAGAGAVLAAAAMIARSQDGSGLGVRAIPLVALALAAGAALPLQGGVNAELDAALGEPVAVGLVSFVVATAAMALLLALSVAIAAARPPAIAPLARVPWWAWLGGVVGAAYVTAVFSLIPRIGAAATIALTVTGQQAASLLVDRYGLLGLPRRAIAPLRVAGIAALFLGVGLIQFG
ncbi:MAG TPA: DMT family transporter [Solirubrobacterales bacterium]|jgi:transporter family-2 protein